MNQPEPHRDEALSRFHDLYGAAPEWLVRAPGRVNLIGEHTDYNDGFVLPMAIDRETWVALRPRADGRVRLDSVVLGARTEFTLSDVRHGVGWEEYPRGVAWALSDSGRELSGWEGVSTCSVPMGAGLSSSASFELAVARAFAAVSAFAWDAPEMARVCQLAENRWVGVACGIMDPMISAVARAGCATLIDCRDLSFTHVPLPPGVAVVVLDTGTRRGLVDSAYNERRAQCERAARACGVRALRDLSYAELEARSGRLDPALRRRARHVVTENERTLAAAAAMAAGDAPALGLLMDASHASLRDDYEVSSPALDALVAAARARPGCLGARMTGAGFGGCAVALVREDSLATFATRLAADYRMATGLRGEVHVCRASDGASGERVGAGG